MRLLATETENKQGLNRRTQGVSKAEPNQDLSNEAMASACGAGEGSSTWTQIDSGVAEDGAGAMGKHTGEEKFVNA
jgi:hypothetical protein